MRLRLTCGSRLRHLRAGEIAGLGGGAVVGNRLAVSGAGLGTLPSARTLGLSTVLDVTFYRLRTVRHALLLTTDLRVLLTVSVSRPWLLVIVTLQGVSLKGPLPAISRLPDLSIVPLTTGELVRALHVPLLRMVRAVGVRSRNARTWTGPPRRLT